MRDVRPERGPDVGVAALIARDGDVLLVRRANPPLAGRWALPGGRVGRGERLADALVREVQEECGLIVAAGDVAAVREVVEGDAHYVLVVLRAVALGGAIRAGDDAAAARWVDGAALAALPLAPGVQDLVAAAMGGDAPPRPPR